MEPIKKARVQLKPFELTESYRKIASIISFNYGKIAALSAGDFVKTVFYSTTMRFVPAILGPSQTTQTNPRQGKARQDKARRGKARQSETRRVSAMNTRGYSVDSVGIAARCNF